MLGFWYFGYVGLGPLGIGCPAQTLPLSAVPAGQIGCVTHCPFWKLRGAGHAVNVMQFDVGGGPGLKVQATHVPVVGSTGFDSPPPSTGQTAVFTHCPFWGPKPDGHVGCASHRPVPKLNVVPVGQLGPLSSWW